VVGGQWPVEEADAATALKLLAKTKRRAMIFADRRPPCFLPVSRFVDELELNTT